jgi:anti-sigma factor RsiW
MNHCEQTLGRLSLYLDNELHGEELSRFETHVLDCATCRTRLENEREFFASVRSSRPLHTASPELRLRVQNSLNETLQQLKTHRRVPTWRFRSAIAAAVLVVLSLPVFVWHFSTPEPDAGTKTSSFALMAADAHLRHTKGQLPLEIASISPLQISEWFGNKVNFKVQLPNYQESSGQEKLYELKGGRLVGFKDDYAAYVAYQMKGQPISLVITSDVIAKPAGGEEIKARGLTFHYNAIHGLKVITWSDRGLTYALVSDLEERGQESCIVCHQGTKDQDFIAPLKPK